MILSLSLNPTVWTPCRIGQVRFGMKRRLRFETLKFLKVLNRKRTLARRHRSAVSPRPKLSGSGPTGLSLVGW